MQRLLIYSGIERKPRALLSELAAEEEIEFTYTSDVEVFEAALKQRNHGLCLVLVRSGPTPELFSLLSKARSLHQFGGAVSLLSVASPQGIRAMLLLGVREVFVEPVAPRRLVQALLLRLRGTPGPLAPSGALEPTGEVECRVHSFGRIGRVSAHTPGELFVETNLVLPEGGSVELVDELPALFGLDKLVFRVGRREEDDLYYAYGHGYSLSHPSSPVVTAGWPALLARFSGDFVRPKPKVLWVGERPLAALERELSPAAYSIHLARPSLVSSAYLARLNPDVVVVDDPAPRLRESIGEWGRSHADRTVVRTVRAGPVDLPVLDARPGALAASWAEQVPLRPSPASGLLFPSRSSPLSRCTFSFPGTLIAVAPRAFELVSPVGISVDGLIEIYSAALGNRGTLGVYGRVIDSRPIEGDRRELIRCEAIPLSDDPQQSLVRAASAVQAAAPASEGTPVVPRRGPGLLIAAGVAVALLIVGAWMVSRASPAPHGGDPASAEEVFESIRRAFD